MPARYEAAKDPPNQFPAVAGENHLMAPPGPGYGPRMGVNLPHVDSAVLVACRK